MSVFAMVISSTAAATLFVGPLAFAIVGVLRARGQPDVRPDAARWNGRLTLNSALACTLAFNLTFFIQELFLVLPKALTPGLSPTLFHNNHTWTGTNPLANLFQGTGAMATILSGAVCAWLFAGGRGRSQLTRWLLFWMAYCGILMALPQVVVGALSGDSDLGRAMVHLGYARGTKLVLALLALLAMPVFALWLVRNAVARNHAPLLTASGRTRWVFQTITLPAILALVFIIPFRVPREFIEVVIVPVAVLLAGIPWMQAGAWRPVTAQPQSEHSSSSLGLIVANLVLLALFQLLLRPGVPFY